jgi:hypothetical protein
MVMGLESEEAARIERCLQWVADYDATLNDAEVAPDGDDYNDLMTGVIVILRDGGYPELPQPREGSR